MRLNDLPVHFTFLDGQIDYHCEGCLAACCENAGRIYLGRQQLELVEELGAEHATPTGTGALLHVDIGFGGCPALEKNGHCALHRQHGPRGKPALCDLFPFSRLLWLDDFLVVAPTLTFVCPLHFVTPGHSDVSHHKAIHAQLTHHFDEQLIAACHEVKLPSHGRVQLSNEQNFLHRVSTSQTESLVDLLSESSGQDIAKALRQADEAMQIGPSPLNDETRALIRPALPSLRSYLYELPEPALDRALGIGLAWLGRLRAASVQPLSLRQAASVYMNGSHLLGLLAQIDQPVSLNDDPIVRHVPDAQAALEAKAILRSIERHPGRDSMAALLKQQGRLKDHGRRLVLQALARSPLRFGSLTR